MNDSFAARGWIFMARPFERNKERLRGAVPPIGSAPIALSWASIPTYRWRLKGRCIGIIVITPSREQVKWIRKLFGGRFVSTGHWALALGTGIGHRHWALALGTGIGHWHWALSTGTGAEGWH
jgi:hypothetical protein